MPRDALTSTTSPERTTPATSEAATLAASLVQPGDVVLVKASRGIGLETVAEALSHG